MSKNLVIGLLVTAVSIATFFVGHQIGFSKATLNRDQRETYLYVVNAALAYSSQADLAQEIVNKNDSKALCMVQVVASAQVNTVRKCLENSECRKLVASEIQKTAPELLGHGELRIKYYKEGELCR